MQSRRKPNARYIFPVLYILLYAFSRLHHLTKWMSLLCMHYPYPVLFTGIEQHNTRTFLFTEHAPEISDRWCQRMMCDNESVLLFVALNQWEKDQHAGFTKTIQKS